MSQSEQTREEKHSIFSDGLLGVLLLAALVLRIWYLSQSLSAPDFASPVLDPQLNDYWARALVSGDWTPPDHAPDPQICSTPYGRPPGYPYILAAIYRAGGGSYVAPRLAQILAGLFNVLLAFLLGRMLWGRGPGLAAAALMAAHWSFIYFEGELNSPVFEICLSLLFVLCLRHWWQKPRILTALLAGCLLGLLALIRPNALLLAPCSAIWLLFCHGATAATMKQRLASATLLCAAVAIVIAPAIARNYKVENDFVLISYYGGVNAYIGNNPEAEGVSAEIPDIQAIAQMDSWNCFNYPELVRGLACTTNQPGMGFADASRYFYKRAADFVLDQPLAALRLTLKKALLFWGPAEVSDSKVIALERQHYAPLRYLPGFPLALALFLAGLMLYLWDKGHTRSHVAGGVGPLLLFIGVYFVSILPFFVAGRYRLPIIPFLLIFGGYALWRVWDRLRQRQYAGTLAAAALVLILVLLTRIAWVPYTPDASKWHLQRGIAYAAIAKPTLAMEELRTALDIDPDNADAHLRLGFELAARAKPEEAVEHYRTALRIKPNNQLVHNNLAYELSRLGDTTEAETLYLQVLELNPHFGLARNNLGNLYLSQDKPEAAIEQFQAVLDSDPADRFAHNNLGNAYRAQGALGQAVEAYKKALANTPRNSDIHYNLGLALAEQGRIEEAEAAYNLAITLSPRYPRAHNSLAYLYAQTGRPKEALKIYRELLRNAPDFALARNNLGNLLAEQGYLDEAKAEFQTVIRQYPDDADAHYNLANLHAKQGLTEAAITQYHLARRYNPKDPKPTNDLGLLLAREKRYDEAIELFQEALKQSPSFAIAHFNLGNVYGELGRLEESIGHLQRALELDPALEQAETNLRTVRQTLEQRPAQDTTP